jgi:hypothetical protein
VVCYLPLVFFEYGWGDDYRLLAFYGRGLDNMELMLSQGRPVKALLANLLFPHLHSIASLRWLRLGCIAVLGVVAAIYAWTWTRAGARPVDAAMISSATFALPGFQIIASFAVGGLVTVALLAAGIAALVAESARAWTRYVLAWLVLALGVGIYPPAAMMFWAFAGVMVLVSPGGLHRSATRLAFVGLSVLPVGLGLYTLGVWRFPPPPDVARGFLASDAVFKADAFLQGALRDSLNLWNVRPVTLLALLVAVACVAGLTMHLRQCSTKLLALIVIFALPVLSYLPNLVSGERSTPYRTQMALSAVVASYLVIAIAGAFGARPRVRTLILSLLALGALTSATYNTLTLIALPKSQELVLVRQHLDTVPKHGLPLRVIPATNQETLAPFVRYGEFGRPSLATWWGAENLTHLVLRERGGTRRVVVVPDSADIDWRVVLLVERQRQAKGQWR